MTPDNLDVDKINRLAECIKNSQEHQDKLAFELIDSRDQQEEIKQSIECFEDIAQDSYYPLMTNDPAIKKDYILKITDQHLNKVFDDKDRKQVLQSILIQDDYMSQMNNKKKKKE